MSLFQTDTYFDRLRLAARNAGFRCTPFAIVREMPLLVLQRPVQESDDGPQCYLSAGIHGNEPAGPLAILRLLQNRKLPHTCAWTLFPLLNPFGMASGIRDNGNGHDLNRDYFEGKCAEVAAHRDWLTRHAPATGYDLSLLLHEDWEASGFYLYELNRRHEEAIGMAVLKRAASLIAIESSTEIDGYPAHRGRIAPFEYDQLDLDRAEELPGAEAIYLFKNYTRTSITLETPSSLPIAERIDAHAETVLAAVAARFRPAL